MKVGDRVDIYYPDGGVEPGEVAAFDQHTVSVRVTGHADAGAVIVSVKRLKPSAQDRWRLDL